MSFGACFKEGCGRPCVKRTDQVHACSRHGGETAIVWGVYHRDNGWYVDGCAGGSYSFDITDGKWFESREDALDELKACDLLPMTGSRDRMEAVRGVASYVGADPGEMLAFTHRFSVVRLT